MSIWIFLQMSAISLQQYCSHPSICLLISYFCKFQLYTKLDLCQFGIFVDFKKIPFGISCRYEQYTHDDLCQFGILVNLIIYIYLFIFLFIWHYFPISTVYQALSFFTRSFLPFSTIHQVISLFDTYCRFQNIPVYIFVSFFSHFLHI